MNISLLNPNKINTNYKPSFQSKLETRDIYAKNILTCEKQEKCEFSNITGIKNDDLGMLEKIFFKKPVPITEALESIINHQGGDIEYKLLERCHTLDQLSEMRGDLAKVKELSDVKLKQLYGIGAFALAFETTDGEILKITLQDHFPHGRKPASFDLPTIKQGKNGYTHYYLQEKVSQENLSDTEIEDFIEKIGNMGYKVKDYIKAVDKEANIVLKKEQFGYAKDEKLYLIDPGCAIKIKEEKKGFLRRLLG